MMRWAGFLASAVLLSLCFPSGGLWWLAWIAFVPFFISARCFSPAQAFGAGYAAGFLFFCLTLFWIYHVTIAGLVLLSSYLALYWAVFGWAAAITSAWPLMRRMLLLPACWVALEYIRANVFTGFGWSSLAHTQSVNLLLIQMADIAGTYGVSYVLMLFNVMAADAVLERPVSRSRCFAWWIVALGLIFVLGYGVWRLLPAPAQGRVRVALVQGNMSLADYWDPVLKPFVVEKHLELSRQALADHPDLIVWPETSFPQFIWEQEGLLESVRSFVRENHVRLLLGAVTQDEGRYYNTAILLNENGDMESLYRKQHLVLFGEYIPLRKQCPWLERFVPIDDFTPGNNQVLMRVGHKKFSSLICFEDTIPSLARQAVNNGAGFLVNITNDAWFGASRQPVMHLDNAVFRAVENRVSLVRATNTGLSCAILPTGAVTGCVRGGGGRFVMVSGVQTVEVPATVAGGAIYRKSGDFFVLLCFGVILGNICFVKFTREGKNV